MATHSTGVGVSKLPVPSYLEDDIADRKESHGFKVTTGKVGKLVLMCIESN